MYKSALGLRVEAEGAGQAVFTVEDNIIAGLAENDEWASYFDSLVVWGLSDVSKVQNLSNNMVWNWTLDPDNSNPEGYVEPGRTLADYNEYIGGSNDFDEFMNVVKSRPLQTWDERYTAKSINEYIRAGYVK